MRIEPRRELLELWGALANWSFKDGSWRWGGRHESNSVSDAQQLLCLMLPAVMLDGFSFADPDRTHRAVLTTLRRFGAAPQIPELMIRVLDEYLDRYTVRDTPVFAGGSHLVGADRDVSLTSEQRGLDVVESYAISTTLMLATLRFTAQYRQAVSGDELRAKIDQLRQKAGKRLTAAMAGLLRSFTVSRFDAETPQGRVLMRTVDQSPQGQSLARTPDQSPEWDPDPLVDELSIALVEVAAALADAGEQTALSGAGLLFECGWSWGVIEGVKPIDFADAAGSQPEGIAEDFPYLYFTMMALNSISGFIHDGPLRIPLDAQQLSLAGALEKLWNATQLYWSILADFVPKGRNYRWPLEDVPWTTTDGVESDYLTLLVAGVAMRKLTDKRALDSDLDKLGDVLIDLANRARITRRPTGADSWPIDLHHPGFELELIPGRKPEGWPQLLWPVQDHAAILLNHAIQMASLVQNDKLKLKVLALSEEIWDHLRRRRISSGEGRLLWDDPSRLYSVDGEFATPSWQMTLRVVESLVSAAEMVKRNPLRGDLLPEVARAMMVEADWLLDRELLGGSGQAGPAIRQTIDKTESNLRRAKELLDVRPASAIAMIEEALLELDRLIVARDDPPSGGR